MLEIPSPLVRGLSELRIDYAPGYRVYYMQKGPIIGILLCGNWFYKDIHKLDRLFAID